MVDRIHQETGKFRWWAAESSPVNHVGGRYYSDLLRWADGAVVEERSIPVDGTEFVEALELSRSLKKARSDWQVWLPPMEEALTWCSTNGLPGSALLTLHEIALPATRIDPGDHVADAWQQQVYVRDAGCWTTYSREWVQEVYGVAVEDAVQDNSWWPTSIWKGSVTHNRPDGTSTVGLLDFGEWFTSDLAEMPAPGTRLWHQHACEDVRGFLQTLDTFSRAVSAADSGDATHLSRFLAGCSYVMKPSNAPYARSKWTPEWSVASLWSGLALQAMHALTATRFHYCHRCGKPFLGHRRAVPPSASAKTPCCSERCADTLKKQRQRNPGNASAKGTGNT